MPLPFVEKRFKLPVGEIAPRAAAIIDLLPGYIDEINGLLA
jgi:hypothetical protein